MTGRISSFFIPLILLSLTYTNAKITLLTNPYPPFTDCSYFSPSNSSSVFGAEIQFLRFAFNFINWTEGTDYEFSCGHSYNFSDLYETLLNDPNSEQGVVGGISITSDRLEAGHLFSQPIVSSPLPLVFKKGSKGWFFRRGLTNWVWVVLFSVVFIVGGILYLLENRKSAYINMVYNAFCQFFFVPDYPLRNYSSKIVQYFSTFVALIVVQFFTATSTNIFQDDQAFASTLTLNNLLNQTVFTSQIFSGYLVQLGILPIVIDDMAPEDLLKQMEEFENPYLITDGLYSDFIVRQHCELYVAFNAIDTIHYGILLDDNFPGATHQLINQAIHQAYTVRTFADFITEYYKSSSKDICKEKLTYENRNISFQDMQGLWYVLGGGFTIGTIALVLNLLGIVISKSLRVYELQGVRAKMDRKIQRRVATVFGIHTAISMQSISILKKLNQEALNEWLLAFQSNFASNRIRRAYLYAIKKDIRILEGSDQRIDCEHTSEYKEDSMSKKSLLVWLKKGSYRRKDESRNDLDASSPTLQQARPKLQKRSTMVRQSMQNYRLGKQLALKVSALAMAEYASTSKDSKDSKIEDSTEQINIDEYLRKLGIHEEETNKPISGASVSMVQRMLGKKGVKVNRKITENAEAALALKETQLIEEYEKKQSEQSEREHLRASLSKLSKFFTSHQSQNKNLNAPPSTFMRQRPSQLHPFIHSNSNNDIYLDSPLGCEKSFDLLPPKSKDSNLSPGLIPAGTYGYIDSYDSLMIKSPDVLNKQPSVVLQIPGSREDYELNEHAGAKSQNVLDYDFSRLNKSSKLSPRGDDD